MARAGTTSGADEATIGEARQVLEAGRHRTHERAQALDEAAERKAFEMGDGSFHLFGGLRPSHARYEFVIKRDRARGLPAGRRTRRSRRFATGGSTRPILPSSCVSAATSRRSSGTTRPISRWASSFRRRPTATRSARFPRGSSASSGTCARPDHAVREGARRAPLAYPPACGPDRDYGNLFTEKASKG